MDGGQDALDVEQEMLINVCDFALSELITLIVKSPHHVVSC